MSVKIMSQVWPLPLTSTQKLVLLALADNCNDRGECYPSISNLSEKTGLSDRGVQKVISELEKMGFVSRSMRYGRSTLYTLTPERGSPPNVVHPEPCSPTPEPCSPPPPNVVHPTPERGSPITVNEPSIEPSPKRQKGETQKSRSPKFDFRKALLAKGVEEKNADAWLEVRKRKRAVNTELAFDELVSQTKEAGLTVNEAVNFSAGMSWAGFRASWYENNKPKPKADSKHTGFNERNYSEGIRADGSF